MKTPTPKKRCGHTDIDEALRLEYQVSFAFYVCAKELIKRYKPLLQPLGLTYTGYLAMLVLWERDNITVTEMGENLFLDSGTLTPLLKKLEKSGLISRSRFAGDEREVRIRLTSDGKKLKRKATHIPGTICSELQVIAEYGDDMLAHLSTLMAHFRRNPPKSD
jgi:Transcriptional regulators